MRHLYAILPIVHWDGPNPIIHICEVDISLKSTILNEELELLEVSNTNYEVKLREINFEWLRDTLVELARRYRVYWSSAEGITSSN